MVKKINLIFSFIIISLCIFTFSCSRNDLFGLFSSLDLDERLKERDSFVLIDENNNWKTSLTLGTSYSFLLITDTHLEDGKTFGLEDKLANKIKEFNDDTDNIPIEFVVFTGDITQKGAEKEILNFIDIAESLGVPVYPVLGNHDFYFDNWKYWRDNIGSTMYRIDAGTATLIILDSGNAFYGKEQLDWLERELKGPKDKTVFVFTHSNLFADGIYNMQQTTSAYERARVVNLLKNKCDIMFMGHTHIGQYNKVGGTEYVVLEGYIEQKGGNNAGAYYIVTVNGSDITRKKHYLK